LQQISLEKLGKQRRHAPPVKDGMVFSHAELKLLFAATVNVKTQERGCIPVERPPFFLFKPCCHRLFLFSLG